MAGTPVLDVAGFSGPLDFLLETVRQHRVDLGQLSIVTLTDQLVAAIERRQPGIALERRAEWLVMASQLLLLKAQLLAPASPRQAEAAGQDAQRRLDLLQALLRMRAAAAWLEARPQLGRQVFGRGQRLAPLAAQRAAQHVAFLEATLAMLEGPDPLPVEAPEALYQPPPRLLWTVQEALRHVAALLAGQPGGLPLAHCLPDLPPAVPDRALRRRAALASTLLAALELARDGKLDLAQDKAFGAIHLRHRA